MTDRARAVLCQPVQAFVTWPDGVAGAAWVLPQGTVVEVSRVHVDAPGGFTVRAHPVEAPELFLVAPVGAMRPLGQRLPF